MSDINVVTADEAHAQIEMAFMPPGGDVTLVVPENEATFLLGMQQLRRDMFRLSPKQVTTQMIDVLHKGGFTRIGAHLQQTTARLQHHREIARFMIAESREEAF